jgi:uncharacterized protein
MAGELLSSKIVVQEVPPRVAALPVVQTAVLGAIGQAVRGPLNEAVLVTSFEEYARTFGEFRSGFELPLAVRQFFLQGGRTANVVRAGTGGTASEATPQSGSDSSGTVLSGNSAPYDLEPGQTLVVAVDGGGDQTATFDAAAASITSGNTETFALADTDTLTLEIDGGAVQTITFNSSEFGDIANATALEVAAVINAEGTGLSATVSAGAVVITSDTRGTGSSVEITGGTANTGGKLNFSTTIVNGTGDVANIDSVTASEVAALLTADVTGATSVVEGSQVRITSNTAGVSSSVQVKASSTAVAIGFDNAVHSGSATGLTDSFTATATSVGTWGDGVVLLIRDSSSGVATEFNLEIQVDGVVAERFANVQTDTPAAANYIETVVNAAQTGSLYITVAVDNPVRPNNNTAPGVPLTGGAEPTVTDTELIGGTSPSLTGIRSLDTVQDVTLLIVPDGATVGVQNAMITYAEITRNRTIFAVLDSPEGADAATMVTHVGSLTATENAGLYWPRVKIPNPDRAEYGQDVENIAQTASGALAGVMARNDAGLPIGPFANPANVEDGRLFGIVGLETDEVLEEAKRDIVFPKRVNPVVQVKGQGFFADGARTLLGTSNFPSVGERRGVSTIEIQAVAALQFAKNKPNTPELRERVENTLIQIILPYVQAGALASRNPSEAFFVDVSDQLNNPAVRAAGQLKARIGLATAKPAEFIVLLVTQDTRALEEQLQSQA